MWPTVHPRELAGKKCQQERPSSPLSSAYASLLSPVSPKIRSFQKRREISSDLCSLQYKHKPAASICHEYSPFSAFCLYLVSSLTNVSQTEADTMKSTESQTFSHRLMSTRNSQQASPLVWKSFSSNLFQTPETKFHFSPRLCRSEKYWWS